MIRLASIAVRFRLAIVIAMLACLLAATPATACTRCMRVFADGAVVVGRSMDWVENPGSEIWLFPRGMKCHGNAGPEILEWTSVHGSVGVSSSTRSRRTSPARRPSPRCSA